MPYPVKKYLVPLFFISSFAAHAQYDEEPETDEESKVNIGFGLGLGYGGIGMPFSVLPLQPLGLFIAGGYNLDGFAYNVGADIRLLPGKKVVPTLLAMYGYNSVIVVQGAPEYNKTYYGPSVGGGVEIHSINGQNFFTVELIAPARPREFKDDLESMKSIPNIEITSPWPVTFSFGYHMKF
jgi:hypothetical protein